MWNIWSDRVSYEHLGTVHVSSMFHVEHCGNISQNERLTSFLSNKMY